MGWLDDNKRENVAEENHSSPCPEAKKKKKKVSKERAEEPTIPLKRTDPMT
jgi:hypothetical protein